MNVVGRWTTRSSEACAHNYGVVWALPSSCDFFYRLMYHDQPAKAGAHEVPTTQDNATVSVVPPHAFDYSSSSSVESSTDFQSATPVFNLQPQVALPLTRPDEHCLPYEDTNGAISTEPDCKRFRRTCFTQPPWLQNYHANPQPQDLQFTAGHLAAKNPRGVSPMQRFDISLLFGPTDQQYDRQGVSSLDNSLPQKERYPPLATTNLTGDGGSAVSVAQNGCRVSRVFVWDLDETIILFNSLLTGSYAQTFNKDPEETHEYGIALEELVYSITDNHFFYNELDVSCGAGDVRKAEQYFTQTCHNVHIDDIHGEDSGIDLSAYDFDADGFSTTNGVDNSQASFLPGLLDQNQTTATQPMSNARGTADWMKKMAFRYRRIRDLYHNNRSCPENLISPAQVDNYRSIMAHLDQFTDGWFTMSKACLATVADRRDTANVLVTSTHLVPALAKLILFGLGLFFDIDAVYSCQRHGSDKAPCFERIAARFGSKASYVVIGDAEEEEKAAREMKWPFWRIACHADLFALQHVLDLGYL